jgi:hypothetical protein
VQTDIAFQISGALQKSKQFSKRGSVVSAADVEMSRGSIGESSKGK